MTPSVQSRRVAWILFWFLRPLVALLVRGPRAVPVLRRLVEAISIEPERGSHVEAGPGGEWVRGPGVAPSRDAAILYLHGSGYFMCSPRSHRGLVAQLSKAAGVPVFSVDYRLAPEHPFPAAADDALDAYRHLLEQGCAAERIVVAGDSAGGHLAVSLVAALTEAELPVPAGLVLFSPLVDPTFELGAARSKQARDPLFTAKVARRMLRLYTANADPEDARLAVLSGDPASMPPVLVHAGTREMLAADAEALGQWLTGAGVSCETKLWEGQIHVFQMLYGLVPEAREALREAGAFIRACYSSSGSGTSAGERPSPVSSQSA